MQSTVFPLKITKRLKMVVMLIFLIIDFKQWVMSKKQILSREDHF